MTLSILPKPSRASLYPSSLALPIMPPRLNHRKSTLGCLRCKARRVKCDEKRPKCNHCTRHAVSCEYSLLNTRLHSPGQAKPSTAVSRRRMADGPRPSLPSPELGGLRVLELRLMHQWITATAATMNPAQLDNVREMWTVSVPQMAFEYEPLLHTLLALGAAHRASVLPNEANNLRPVYHAYIHSALQRHRPATANLDNTTSESVCLNAVLISLYTLFLRSEPSSEPYEPPILWLSMSSGIRTVLKSVYHTLVRNNSRLCPLLLAQPTLWNQTSTFYKGPAHPFQFLLDYRPSDEVMDEDTVTAYAETIAYVERFYICVQNREPEYVLRKTFSGFPPIVPTAFLGFVAEKRPRALAILAYHFSLVKSVDNVWWLRGIPEREVRGIASIMPEEWKWTMAWPLNLVSELSGRENEYPTPTEGRSAIEAIF